ncbi:hypothetical protein MRBBS_3414 [Marinobacter sp. BSs20148]|nr:hypothetical protein MRBBS_3414 [Marinobacter sp. BSs20148]
MWGVLTLVFSSREDQRIYGCCESCAGGDGTFIAQSSELFRGCLESFMLI